jgi:hypothetical protein
MRIELRLPEDSDSNPATPYRWLWSASEGVGSEGNIEDFVEKGVRRYRFEFEQQGEVSLALKNVFPRSTRQGPAVRARIVIEVDEVGGLPE